MKNHGSYSLPLQAYSLPLQMVKINMYPFFLVGWVTETEVDCEMADMEIQGVSWYRPQHAKWLSHGT